MAKKTDGKIRIGIVGSVINGKSYDGWYGTCTGCDTIKQKVGTKGDIEVYINSPGGSVFAGFEIMNVLTAAVEAGRKVDIYISAMAASIASYISTGVVGATVYAAPNSKIMYHAPWSVACGSKDEMRDMADLLEKMEGDLRDAISSRGVEPQDEWFAAARMKWFNAKEALKANLIDAIKAPSSELIAAVSGNDGDGNEEDDYMDRGEEPGNKVAGVPALDNYMKIAANMEFTGYVLSLCKEHYGEEKAVAILNMTKDSFEVIFDNDEKSLLKYAKDAINIVNIEWEADASQKKLEKPMKTPEELKAEFDSKLAEANARAVEANAKATEAEAKIAEANAKAETAEAKTVEAEARAVAAEAKITEMESKARAKAVAKIMANEANVLTEEELASLDLATVEKIASIATVAEKVDDKTDKSLIKPNGKDDEEPEATLPPPEL